MAEISGFHNSINGDRKVKADFFARFFGSLIGNGVFPNPSTGCQVIANNDMTVTVKAGKAWINGYYYENTDDLTLTLETADGVLKRIDRIVLQYSTIDRTIVVKVKKGTFASTPAAPALQRDADAYELGLADIYIVNGAVSISQANITDLRLNNTYCGIVHGVVDQVDTTTLFNQYQAWIGEKQSQFDTSLINYATDKQIEIDQMQTDFTQDFINWRDEERSDFDTWFITIQDILSGDVAGNLLSIINNHAANTANHVTAEKQVAWDNLKTFQTAGGAGTAITLSNVELTDGFQTTFVILTSNSGAATTINAKPLYKPGTTSAPKLIAGKAATVWYNLAGDCFFIKASAEGTATAGDVLATKTFSNDNDTGLTGTMVNRGAITITPSTTNQAIATGYHNGSGYVAGDTDLIAGNIIPSVNIFGVVGNAPVKKYATGSLYIDQYTNYIIVTGLTFKPTLINIYDAASGSPNLDYQTVYNSLVSTTNGSMGKSGQFQISGTFYVNSTSFKLPVSTSLTPRTFTWLAFE